MYKVSSLDEDSGYTKLLDHYNKNKHKKWDKWLTVHKIFPRPGKQGLVGIFQSKEDPDIKYVFKISQYINFLVQHELTVMKSLNEMISYCPHFCKGIGGILANVDPKSRKEGNPFENNSKYTVEKEVLLMEYLDKSTKFYNYIKSSKISDQEIYSIVKQTLLAILMAQNKVSFTHYDLHSNNIMMKKCDKDLVFLYVIDEENQYCVPTYGHYPVIIDFGFSYSEKIGEGPLWPSLGHTEVGFTSDRFDKFSDPKLLLVTVAEEIYEKRRNKTNKKLKRIVRNMFSPLNIDWSSGWDKEDELSASDHVLEMLSDYNTKSELFTKYDHFCIDLIQSLIVLPLQEQNYSSIDKSFKAFINEFVKIENEIGNSFFCLYILKGIADTAREVRSDYLNPKSRKYAVKQFRNIVYEYIDSVSKYCQVKDLHFERMLCALLCLGRNIEGVLYDVLVTKTHKMESKYKKLPLQTIEQMYAAIEVNISDKYVFHPGTTVMVLNSINETCSKMILSEGECEAVNDEFPLCRGTTLFDILKNKEQ